MKITPRSRSNKLSGTEKRILRQLPHSLMELGEHHSLEELLGDPYFFLNCYSDCIERAFHMWAVFCKRKSDHGGTHSTSRLPSAEARTQGKQESIISSSVKNDRFTVSEFPNRLAEKLVDLDDEDTENLIELNQSIGMLFFQIENYEKAAELFNKSLNLCQPNYNKARDILLNKYLGESYLRFSGKNNVELAKGHYFKALELSSDISTNDHPSISYVESLHNCGHYYFMKAQYKTAMENYYNKAYDLANKIENGPFFIHADSQLMIGQCLRNLGRDKEAKSAFDKSSLYLDSIRDINIAEIAWMIVLARDIISSFYLEIGEAKLAEKEISSAYELSKRYYQSYHIKTIKCLTELYRIRVRDGRKEDAINDLTKILDSYEGFGESVNLNTLESIAVLSESVYEIGGAEHSISMLEKYISKASTLGAISELALLKHNLGYIYLSIDRLEDATDSLTQAFEIREETLEPGHEFTLRTLTILIPGLLGLNDLEAAKNVMSCYLDKTKNELYSSDARIYSSLMHIAVLFKRYDIEYYLDILKVIVCLGEKLISYEKNVSEQIVSHIIESYHELAIASTKNKDASLANEYLNKAIQATKLKSNNGDCILFNAKKTSLIEDGGSYAKSVNWKKEIIDWLTNIESLTADEALDLLAKIGLISELFVEIDKSELVGALYKQGATAIKSQIVKSTDSETKLKLSLIEYAFLYCFNNTAESDSDELNDLLGNIAKELSLEWIYETAMALRNKFLYIAKELFGIVINFSDRIMELGDIKQISQLGISYNEVAFWCFMPKKNYVSAEKYFDRAVSLMKKANNESEVANISINRDRSRFLGGQKVSKSEIVSYIKTLEKKGDPRVKKGYDLIAMIEEKVH